MKKITIPAYELTKITRDETEKCNLISYNKWEGTYTVKFKKGGLMNYFPQELKAVFGVELTEKERELLL
jgi:adenine C2-methylase RlmN of 23S rRNA A2503 and tRNA A37